MKPHIYFYSIFLSLAAYLLSLFVFSQTNSDLGSFQGSSQEDQAGVLALFLLLFFSMTLFLLMLFKVHRGSWLYRVLFAGGMWMGLMLVFQIVFPFEFSSVLAGIFLLGFFFVPTVWTHDVIVILASAGIGPIFGAHFSPQTAILLLIILSVYDYIAVFVTQHMASLAHELVRHQASFALFVPEGFRDFGAHISQVRPGAGFLILGGGDLIIPMILLTAVASTSMAVALCGVIGLVGSMTINHYALVVLHKPIPALPALTLGLIGGISAGQLFF